MRCIILKCWYFFIYLFSLPTRLRLGSCGENVYFSPFMRIKGAKHVRIGNNVRFIGQGFIQGRGGVHVGSNTSIAEGVSVLSLEHRFRGATKIPYDTCRICKPVTIGSQVWLGRNVILLPGTTLGEGVIVGAGSVVSGEVAPLSIIAGNPAQIIGQRNQKEYESLKAREAYFTIQDIIDNGWKFFENIENKINEKPSHH